VPRACLGVAWTPYGENDPDELLARADAAMYAVKRARGDHRQSIDSLLLT
jgi:GGDEF domain-containing protein